MSWDCLSAARKLLDEGHLRSSVNRSYYAAYGAVDCVLISMRSTKHYAAFANGGKTLTTDLALLSNAAMPSTHSETQPSSSGHWGCNRINKKQVVKFVCEHLTNCHPGGVTLEVLDREIWREDDYWYVPVRPSAQPPHTFEYYDALAEVETDLSLNAHLEVLLVPTLPEQEENDCAP